MKNNIKVLREQKKLTQQECADIFGVKLRAWQTYEQGVSEPKFDTLCKIADYFNVSLDYLLGREPQTDPLKMLNLQPIEDTIVERYMKLPAETRKTFIEILMHIAGSAEKSIANEMANLREQINNTVTGFKEPEIDADFIEVVIPRTIDDLKKKSLEFEEYTAGELHEIMKSSDEDNAV